MSNLQVSCHWVPQNTNFGVEHLDHAWTPNTAQSVTPQTKVLRRADVRCTTQLIRFAQPYSFIASSTWCTCKLTCGSPKLPWSKIQARNAFFDVVCECFNRILWRLNRILWHILIGVQQGSPMGSQPIVQFSTGSWSISIWPRVRHPSGLPQPFALPWPLAAHSVRELWSEIVVADRAHVTQRRIIVRVYVTLNRLVPVPRHWGVGCRSGASGAAGGGAGEVQEVQGRCRPPAPSAPPQA